VRQFRTPGSARGASGNRRLYLNLQKMRESIGATLYGFMIGGSVFLLQILLIGIYEYLVGHINMEPLLIAGWCIIIGMGLAFIIAVLFWLSCVFVVFPASFLFRALQLSPLIAVGIGGLTGGMICWIFLGNTGYNNYLQWAVYWSCLSSSIVTGSVTSFVLCSLNKRMGEPQR
jgi:hypothetical protein